jgi:AhpD family alkylhydroperoxidase
VSERINYPEVVPGIIQALVGVESVIARGGLDHSLLELVKLRASQINGCSYCLNMHATALRQRGEPNSRIDLVAGWHEAPVYSERERAALAWTEAVTLLVSREALDGVFELARTQFDDAELVNLTAEIGMINVWNRLNVAFQQPPVL